MWPGTRDSISPSNHICISLQLLSFQAVIRQELIHILTHRFWQCVTCPILNYCSLYLLDFTISLFHSSFTQNYFSRVMVVTTLSPKQQSCPLPFPHYNMTIKWNFHLISFLLSSQKLKDCVYIKRWDKAWTGNHRINTEWCGGWSLIEEWLKFSSSLKFE